MIRVRSFVLLFFTLCVFSVGTHYLPPLVHADTSDDIQAQIDAHNQKIKDLDAEIATYQKQLDALGNQHQTLASSIKSLDVTRAQLTSKIKSLQQQIASLNLELAKLGKQITAKEKSITLSKRTIAQSLRTIASAETTSLVEQVFSSDSLTDAWTQVDATITLAQALRDHTDELTTIKQELTTQQQEAAQTAQKLSAVTTDLGTQKKAVDVTVQEKSTLLTQTKNQESSYQKLIATKKAQQKAFESEMQNLQSQLKSIGASSIPRVGSGILAWPYSASFAQHCLGIKGSLGNNFCITQYFGNTAFAASGAYNGNGHNGIDIGMPTGTPIQSSLSGTVLGTGNTDESRGANGAQCYSFGKWVAVKHPNGLATVYAHLSSISVSAGQSVSTGQVIGYSGMTGYATGPHLHYGVYASAGLQIMTLGQFKGGATSACAQATMPVAPLNAYLNPMSYL